MFYDEKKASTIHTSLDRIFTKKQNMLIANVSNVLNYNLLSKYWLHYSFHFDKHL